MSSLDDIFARTTKKFGAGILSENTRVTFGGELRPTPISTGSLLLDWAIGGEQEFGGIYRRRITTVYGAKGTGKTTLANSVIASCQQNGGKALLVELEEKYDKQYAEACGVDLDSLMFLHTVPEDRKFPIISGEQVLIITQDLIESGEIDLVVIDSIAGLSPKREIDGETGESNPGLQAFLVTQFVRKMPPRLARNNTAMLINNQVRDKFGAASFESHTKMPGANALVHHSAVIIRTSRGYASNSSKVKDGNDVIGQLARFTIEQNQISNPFKSVDVPIISGEGFDIEKETLDFNDRVDFIRKSGAWVYVYDENGEEMHKWQGMQKAAQALKENSELLLSLRERIKIAMASNMSQIQSDEGE